MTNAKALAKVNDMSVLDIENMRRRNTAELGDETYTARTRLSGPWKRTIETIQRRLQRPGPKKEKMSSRTVQLSRPS